MEMGFYSVIVIKGAQMVATWEGYSPRRLSLVRRGTPDWWLAFWIDAAVRSLNRWRTQEMIPSSTCERSSGECGSGKRC